MAVTDYNLGFNNGLAVGINIKGAEGSVAPLVPVAVTYKDQSASGLYASGTSFNITAPASVVAGDFIAVVIFSRSLVSAPAGFIKVAYRESATFAQWLEVWTKVADGSEAGAVLTFTQPYSGRFGISLTTLVCQTAIVVEELGYSDMTTADGIHPIPIVTALGDGRLQLSASDCVYSTSPLYEVTPPDGWIVIRPDDTVDNRMAAAVRSVDAGVTSYCYFNHHPGTHIGIQLTVLFAPS